MVPLGAALMVLFWIRPIGPSAYDTPVVRTPPAYPLPAVRELPAPTLPLSISEIYPRPNEESATDAQIRIRFTADLVPLSTLESPLRATVLRHFSIEPRVPGRFLLLTPRLVVFECDAPFPNSTRFRLTVQKGLQSLSGVALPTTLAWTFATAQDAIDVNLPDDAESENHQPFPVRPEMPIKSDVPVDVASLRDRVYLHELHSATPIDAGLRRDAREPNGFIVTPVRALSADRAYVLEVRDGVIGLGQNIPMAPARGSFKTVSPLRLGSLERSGVPLFQRGEGRFSDGIPKLVFNNPLSPESVFEHVHVDRAAVPPYRSFKLSYDRKAIELNPAIFPPDSSSIVTLDAELGDQFGQRLGNEQKVTIATGDLAPMFWAAAGLAYLLPQQRAVVRFRAENLKEYHVRLRPFTPANVAIDDPPDPRDDSGPYPAAWTRRRVDERRNESTTGDVFRRDPTGGSIGAFSYSVAADTSPYFVNPVQQKYLLPRRLTFNGVVSRTDIGLFIKTFHRNSVIRTNRLTTGEPIAGVAIRFYTSSPSGTDSGSPLPCASGTTNDAGTLIAGSLEACATRYQALIVTAQHGNDWTFARTTGPSYEAEESAALVPDRAFIEPGEPVHVTLLGYSAGWDRSRPEVAPYELTLTAPDGRKTELGSFTVSPYGVASILIPLAKQADSGSYNVAARTANGRFFATTFVVANERKPLYSSSLDASSTIAASGDSVTVTQRNAYLWGAPVSHALVRFSVRKSPSSMSFSGWPGFAFGVGVPAPRMTFAYGRPDTNPSEILATVRSDDRGVSRVAVHVPDSETAPMQYRVEAQALDATNAAVAVAKSFATVPSGIAVGLDSGDPAATAEVHRFRFIAVDLQGHAVAQAAVHFELQTANPNVNDAENADWDERKWRTVNVQEGRSGLQPQSIEFGTPEAGRYRVRATAIDARGRLAVTIVEFLACGAAPTPASDLAAQPIVKLDKERYKAGESVVADVTQPATKADVLIGIVGRSGIQQLRRAVFVGTQRFTFDVTPDMVPAGSVEVIAIPQRPSDPGTRGASLRTIASFSVLDEQPLLVSVKPLHKKLEPGAVNSLSIHVADTAGRPSRAQVIVAVVDRAVAQLDTNATGAYIGLSDPTAWSYSGDTFDNRNFLWPSTRQPLEERESYPFRDADACPSMPLSGPRPGMTMDVYSLRTIARSSVVQPFERRLAYRHIFHALAYYNAELYTDSSGNVRVKVPLPENATTWDVRVIAATPSGYVATAATAFTTSAPFLVHPAMPLFLRPGDVSFAGMLVTNGTARTGRLDLRFSAGEHAAFQGKVRDLRFSDVSAPKAGDSRTYRAALQALSAGKTGLRFGALFGNRSDGFALPLSVEEPVNDEDVAVTGRTQTSSVIPLVLPHGRPAARARIDVDIASSLLPEVNVPLMALVQDDFPTSFYLAAKIRALSDAVAFAQIYRQFAVAALLRLQLRAALLEADKFARADGGYSEFAAAGYGSDWDATTAMLKALARANDIAGEPSPAAVAGAVSYVNGRLHALSGCAPLPWCGARPYSDVVSSVIAVHDAKGDVSGYGDLCAGIRLAPATIDSVETALAYSRFIACGRKAADIQTVLVRAMRETSRSLVGGDYKPGCYEGRILSLLIATHADEALSDRVLTGLLAAQHDGRWYNFICDADALDGIADYAAHLSAPPDFTANVRAGNARFSQRFQGFANMHARRTIPAQAFSHAARSIELSKEGSGTLHYAAVLHYAIEGKAAGQYAGIRVDRFVREARSLPVVATFGLAEPSTPQMLREGVVYDVEDRIVSDHPVDNLVLVDPLPAGIETINESFATASSADAETGVWWGYRFRSDYVNVTRDRLISAIKHLDAGVRSLHYLVRATVPGTYLWPAASARLQYVPEDFGRSATGYITVTPAAGAIVLTR